MNDCQRARGSSRLATASKVRSTAVIAGRHVVRRKIASSWRRTMISKFLKLLRPRAQGHEFEQPPHQHVAQRHEHEASYVTPRRPDSTHKPDRIRPSSGPGSEFLHPSGSAERVQVRRYIARVAICDARVR